MTIQKRHRSGERNKYQRKPRFDKPQFTDLSASVVNIFLRKVEKNLPDGITFMYNDSNVIAFEHTSTRAAYLLDFYPLDVDLYDSEVKEIRHELANWQDLHEIGIIEDILLEQVENIVDEVNRVKSYHPESELTIVFGPADTLNYVGTPARPIYMFLLESDETARLETESSFVVLPNDEMSRAYMED